MTAVGNCFEFGVSIDGSCGHAMIVAPEGGSCGCATCGAKCGGRFAACVSIIERPGYIPTVAPAWAVGQGDLERAPVDGLATESPFAHASTDRGPLGEPFDETRSGTETVRDEPTPAHHGEQHALDRVVGEMRAEMQLMVQGVALERDVRDHEERDAGLAAVLQQVAMALGVLTEQLVADREERAVLIDAIGRIAEALPGVEPGVATRTRLASVVGGTVDPRLAELDVPVAASHGRVPPRESIEIDLTETASDVDDAGSAWDSPRITT